MRILFALILLFTATLPAVELAEGLTLSGWDKQYVGVSGMPENMTFDGSEPYKPQELVQQSLRLRLFYKPISWFSAETAWQVSPTVSRNPSTMSTLFTPSLNDYRITDFKDTLYTTRAVRYRSPTRSTGSLSPFHSPSWISTPGGRRYRSARRNS